VLQAKAALGLDAEAMKRVQAEAVKVVGALRP